jgi:hypothetical protein
MSGQMEWARLNLILLAQDNQKLSRDRKRICIGRLLASERGGSTCRISEGNDGVQGQKYRDCHEKDAEKR